MEEELRLSLLVLGACFIVGVLAHGIWNIRKNNQKKVAPRVEPKGWEGETDNQQDTHNAPSQWYQDDDVENGFDDDGVGKVRVVSAAVSSHAEDEYPDEVSEENADEPQEHKQTKASHLRAVQTPAVEPEPKLYGSVVSNPKPHIHTPSTSGENTGESIPEPPGFLLKTDREQSTAQTDSGKADSVEDFSLDPQPSPERPPEPANEEAVTPVRKVIGRKKTRSQSKRRQEPSFGDEEQMRIDFDEPQPMADESKPQATSSASDAAEVATEVLILNVRAPDEEPISGAALLPMLLTLGFKFGDQDIFHRHVNSNGKGPVLFSLANMFKPGNFDIDNLENFTTRGVSLFMLLPIEGDPHQVFNMMHNAARKIADEFGAQVLDGRRSVLTKQGLQQYVEKIREFERKRMIARH